MKKVCVITATRAEYGLLRWLIKEIDNDSGLELQLIATGTHLSKEYGLTYKEIEKDGFEIDEKVDISVSPTLDGIVKSMGYCSIGFSDAFLRLSPDIIVVLGDRYELLPICGAALVMRIPIAHISGGDITLGAIDDQIRNAATMMASIHFPGTEESADRIKRMTTDNDNVFCVGEPGLDSFKRLRLWDRKKLADNLGLDISKKWVLMTYHPETKISLDENMEAVRNIILSLENEDGIEIIVTGANADYGGNTINAYLKEIAIKNKKFRFVISLGQIRYLSLMKDVEFVIGNSSSGIYEAPYLAKPVVNVGDRQKGRFMSPNIINSSKGLEQIKNSIKKVYELEIKPDNYFGDGDASRKIKDLLVEFLYKKK